MFKKNRTKLLIVLLSLAAIYVLLAKKGKMKAIQRNRFLAEFFDFSAIFEDHVTPVQPIHIVTVMTSLEHTKTFPLQFKSILYHRSSPVVLHLFLNSDLQQRVIETLLSTWPADQVYYEIYRIEETINRATLSVILDGFRRLTDFTKEMVYISPRIIFTSDIKDWIPKCDVIVDCAILFLDSITCTDLNEHNCEEAPELAFLNLEENEEFLQQNITEPVFQNEEIKLLPCDRTSLHLESLKNSADRCHNYSSRIKSSSVFVIRDDLLVEESLESDVARDLKEAIRTIEASEPRNRLYMFGFLSFEFGFEMDGNDSNFRSLNPESKELDIQSASNDSLTTTKSPKNDIDSFCEKFLEIAHLKRVTHIFYHYGEKIKKLDSETSDKIEITLLTALTLDRISSLEIMLTHWTGPAAVLFYISDSEVSYQLPKLLSSSSVFRMKSVMDRIAIHLVYKTLTFNPINYLRNVLLNNSLTSHNVYIDVDLVPNPGSYESIKKTLEDNKNSKFSDRLFMIPAFRATTQLQKNFPKNKEELVNLIKDEIVSGYSSDKKQPGHYSTNYDKWVKTNSTYEAAYVRYFEPYLIVARSLPARFNEDLVERMQDKIAYVRTFRAMGFKFFVLPDDFITHLPHPESHGKKIFHAEPRFSRCDVLMNKRHENYLRKIYPKAKI